MGTVTSAELPQETLERANSFGPSSSTHATVQTTGSIHNLNRKKIDDNDDNDDDRPSGRSMLNSTPPATKSWDLASLGIAQRSTDMLNEVDSESTSVSAVPESNPVIEPSFPMTGQFPAANVDEWLASLRFVYDASRHQTHIVHFITPADTIPGLALLYDIDVEELERTNTLWHNDSLQSRRQVRIPLTMSEERFREQQRERAKQALEADQTRQAEVIQLQELTGVPLSSTARLYLRRTNGDVQRAAELFFSELAEREALENDKPQRASSKTKLLRAESDSSDEVDAAVDNSNTDSTNNNNSNNTINSSHTNDDNNENTSNNSAEHDFDAFAVSPLRHRASSTDVRPASKTGRRTQKRLNAIDEDMFEL